jgi:hypothetical protein
VERRLKATRRTPIRRARVITVAMFSTVCGSNPAMPERHAPSEIRHAVQRVEQQGEIVGLLRCSDCVVIGGCGGCSWVRCRGRPR